MNNLTTRKIVLGTADGARAGVQRAGHRRGTNLWNDKNRRSWYGIGWWTVYVIVLLKPRIRLRL